MERDIQSIPVTFANTGIVTKSAEDEIPITSYKMLSNAQTDRENSVSVRKGFTRLNDGLTGNPCCAYYLRDYQNIQWRYAIVNGQLYVAPITDPEDASIWPIALGNEYGPVLGANNLSSALDPRAIWTTFSLQGTVMKPYIFFADGQVFLKHSGGFDSARRVGIPAPNNPILSVARSTISDELLEDCEDYTLWTGGDSAGLTASDYPSAWNYGVSTMLARWYYAKYTFVLNDGTETFCSSANYPHYIQALKKARMFWKKAYSTLEEQPLANPGAYGTYFNDGVSSPPPDAARIHAITISSGDYIDRIGIVYMKPDGTIVDGPWHGGGGGTLYTFTLDFDEYITEIKGKYGVYIDSITIVTNKRESTRYGGTGGSSNFSLTIPAGTTTSSTSLIGFHGKTNGSTAFQNKLTSLGLIIRRDTYDNTSTAPGTAVGWNLYVGSSTDNVVKVNDTPIGLTEYYDEPSDGFAYTGITPPLPNTGDLSNDASGETGNAIKMSLTGSSKSGSAIKLFTNSVGYPIIKDLGIYDPDESFKISLKFADAEAISNCSKIRLKFIISDIAGDTGENFKYYAIAEISDFSGFTPGSWDQVQLSKNQFILKNYSGSDLLELGWGTVSGLILEVLTTDPATGGETCVVSFDNIIYSPAGKLNGSNLSWTYTFYNSKTDTESDYATPFENTLGALTNEAVQLEFPPTPLTNPPMANPDKIRIYRSGGTLVNYQRVGEIDYVAGFGFSWIDNVSDEYALDADSALETDNQLPPEEVEGVEIWDNRMWVWGGVSLDGIQEPLNRLRFSKSTRIEHFPSDNYIYVGTGNERIMRVKEHDGELFVFTTTKVYRIVGQNGNYRPVGTAVNQGLMNKFCVCRGTRALFMRSYDGIYEFPSGRKISEPINQIFFNENVNGIEPVALGREPEEAMGFHDSKLFFSYCSTTDTNIRNDRTLIWDTLNQRWTWYIYGAQDLFSEPETNYFVGCNLTQWYQAVAGVPVDTRYSGAWTMRLENGYADQCESGTFGLPCIIDTKEYDLGYPDQEKQFIELVVDADTKGYPIIVQASFDGGDLETIGVIATTERSRQVFPIVLGEENGKMAVRMSVRLTFESDPTAISATRIYKIVHRVLIEPPRRHTHVTDWSKEGHEGPKFFHRLWVEMDTFGIPLTSIEVQVDQETVKTITDNVTADGRRKYYYGMGVDIRGILSRLKFNVADDQEVKVYGFGFEITPEPPLINTFQTPWSDDGYGYRKLWKHVELDIDTEGKVFDVNFWLDGEIVQTFTITTENRKKITQSFDQELFGKLGRLTMEASKVDSDGNEQGVRLYDDPKFITDRQHPDITIADSFSQTLENDRLKVLRQMYYMIDNPDASVQLTIYIDGLQRDSYTILNTSTTTPSWTIRRQDFPGDYKGKIFRFVFTSDQAFEINWPRTRIILRDLNGEDPHRRPNLEPPQTY